MKKEDKTKWLYGDYEPEPIPSDIALRRIEALDNHLSELLEVDFWSRDDARIRDVLKAKEFWEKFLTGEYQ
jgi:hypothetical protein